METQVKVAEKKTVVLGASERPDRYSNMAVRRLKESGHPIVAVGLKEGEIVGIPILKGHPEVEDVDTVTLYVGPANQIHYYDYILQLQPKRIIMNPGTENAELTKMAEEKGIDVIEACTLVMLSTGQY